MIQQFARTIPNTDHASVRPLYVNNCGYYQNNEHDIYTRREHGRQDYQLILVVRGEVVCADREQTLGANSILLYAPHEKQDYIYRGGADTLYYFLHFSGKTAAAYAQELLPKAASVELGAVIPRLKAIMAELQTHEIGFETRCAGLMLCLFSELARHMHHAEPNADHLAVLLSENLAQPLCAPCFAQLHGTNGRSAVRYFQQYTGMTPLQYQQQLRVTVGAQLLRETDQSVSQIAAAVGYADPLYFSRVFRRITGYSPSLYRKRLFV